MVYTTGDRIVITKDILIPFSVFSNYRIKEGEKGIIQKGTLSKYLVHFDNNDIAYIPKRDLEESSIFEKVYDDKIIETIRLQESLYMRESIEILSKELEKKCELYNFHRKLMREGNTLYKASFEKQSQLYIEIENLSQDIATLNSTYIVADLANIYEFHKASQISPPKTSATHQGGVIIERN